MWSLQDFIISGFYFFGLNMFFVFIKSGSYKISSYLILIDFLVSTKINLLIIRVPSKTNLV